ncbi:NAD-dependent protein deacetylase sirtuin-1-like [Centruroides sculpturatus]|uniref:NAD-dependent protein deacetylase sirtuin-1-like n=1 Tax=Centruroides sculpturatus TaxID=218467 RepID=UPI000C6DB7B1|nr:NAD-dependent protein deacetylase sirtuin-1-like [Centruroides sculpturatus]
MRTVFWFDVKMAEAVQTSCASPRLKRPRLDNDDHIVLSLTSYDSKLDNCVDRGEDGCFAVPYEVTSTSDPQNDTYGGDSGFHELTPPVSAGYVDSTSIDELNLDLMYDQHIDFVNGIHIPDPDSSQTDLLGQPSVSTYSSVDDINSLVPDNIENDADEIASTISDLSGLSDLSDFSGQEWKPTAGPVSWVQRQMSLGADPHAILSDILPKGTLIPSHLDEVTLWKIIVNMLSEPPRRQKLANVNTMEDVVQLLKTCNKIIILTGAGVSVSCGIPDFRSINGIYARLSKEYPDLPDPQAMFDINYFRKDPRPFFKFAKEIYPGQFQPSPSHRFIRLLEQQNKLLRNYTQNIDTLEQAAGIVKAITCHGSFATATCTQCGYKVDCSVIKDEIFNQQIPYCPYCPPDIEEMAVMKPDIVFFGEGLSDEFHQTMAKDKDICDLLIVIGSSLKVRPVALIPSSIPPNVPQILINREPLKHLTFDVELLGDCDVIIKELCSRLGEEWLQVIGTQHALQQIAELPSAVNKNCTNVLSESEVNNNNNVAAADTTTAVEANSWNQNSDNPAEEESSCDCNNLSNIRIEDSLDGIVDSDQSNNNPDSTSNDRDSEPQSTRDIEKLRECWQSTQKQSLSSRLPENTFLIVPPNRYVFHGAELYLDEHLDTEGEVSSMSVLEEQNYNAPSVATNSNLVSSEEKVEATFTVEQNNIPENVDSDKNYAATAAAEMLGTNNNENFSCS